MKNLKNVLIAMLFAFTLVSCGGDEKENDPKPTNEEILSYVGYWEFVSATVVRYGANDLFFDELMCEAYNTDYPMFYLEFDVKSDNTALQKISCKPDVSLTYSATFSNDELSTMVFEYNGIFAYSFGNFNLDESTNILTTSFIGGYPDDNPLYPPTAIHDDNLREAIEVNFVFKLVK